MILPFLLQCKPLLIVNAKIVQALKQPLACCCALFCGILCDLRDPCVPRLFHRLKLCLVVLLHPCQADSAVFVL